MSATEMQIPVIEVRWADRGEMIGGNFTIKRVQEIAIKTGVPISRIIEAALIDWLVEHREIR